MNQSPILSSAGIWVPVVDTRVLSSSYNGTLANTFHAVIALDNRGHYGLVVTGWGYSGWPPTLSTVAPVSMALLAPDAAGKLTVSTSQYITDPVTNGGGSAIVADFNGDGRQDIVLPAHNESPFLAMPSTAWMSNASGGFTKVVLNDLVMAHDAELVYIHGKPAIATATFTTDDKGNPVAGALRNPIYTYANGAFVVTTPANISNLGGMDTTLADSGAAGVQLLRGDVGSSWSEATGWADQNITVYAFDGNDVTSTTPLQSIVPYLSTLPQYAKFPAQIGGPGLTHTYRLWADDLNHDGKQDILAGESMWSQSNPDFPSALQVLMNQGNGTFKDATAALNPDMGFNTSEMDYNPNFVDLDHSGIKTYLFAGSMSWGSLARQSDYVLLNDGTGRLYVALHDQFTALAKQVFAFLGMGYDANSTPPRFIAIPQPDGSLNFVAEVPGSVYNSDLKISQTSYEFVNVPLQYNPTTDFTQNINITDRNNSMLLRTWAGDDIFYDTHANTMPAHIDGGLGMNTARYSGASKAYALTFVTDASGTPGVKVKTLAASGTSPTIDDTLVRVQQLQFTDRTVHVDVQAHASYADVPDALYQFFITAFAAAPGVTYMDQLAQAYRWFAGKESNPVKTIVDIFTTKPQFTDVYPASLDHASLATQLVERIVKTSATPVVRASAVADVTAALDGGWSVGDVIYTVFGNLANKSLNDAAWGNTARQFANEVEVAKVYTDALSQSTTDLDTLRAVLYGVTATTDVSSHPVVAELIGVSLLHPTA